jgi:hypothetical protein
MRRSSIGLPLQPSDSPDLGGDAPFDDDDGLFDRGADGEEPESPTTPSKQPQTPRRAGPSNAVQHSEDTGTPKARSKSKAKERNEDHDGEEVEGLEDAEVPQEDEDREVTPKKPKRSRKRAVEVPCKKPFAVVQPSC